jgi:hypothetical protein
MAYSSPYLFVVDQNLGAVAVTVNQSSQGAIQIDGVIRLNRSMYLAGDGLLECLALQDRYSPAQAELGYPACNFVDPAAIIWLAPA